MKPNPEQDADRAAFEKWASLPENRFNLGCGSTGFYKEPLTRGAYAGWQACEAQSAARIAKLEAIVKGLYDDNMDYLTRNNLGGENNHWMKAARKALTNHKGE